MQCSVFMCLAILPLCCTTRRSEGQVVHCSVIRGAYYIKLRKFIPVLLIGAAPESMLHSGFILVYLQLGSVFEIENEFVMILFMIA